MFFFFIFVMCFGFSYHVLGIDYSSYGRLNAWIAHFIAAYRSALGEFGYINPYETLDVKDTSVSDEIAWLFKS
jgi:hypothetical protein